MTLLTFLMVCNEYAFPFLSGVLPPASQAGWRGGHTESSDTSAQGRIEPQPVFFLFQILGALA